MGRSIRTDLTGVVIAHTGNGQWVTLAAGDPIPDAARVGDHLLAKPGGPDPDAGAKTDGGMDRPTQAESKDAWYAYARYLGLEVDDSAKKTDLIAAVKAHDAAAAAALAADNEPGDDDPANDPADD